MQNQKVREGATVSFRVQVEGDPKPDIMWKKDGKPLSKSARLIMKEEETTKILTLMNATMSDAGLYGVVASNESGEAESEASLEVFGKCKLRKSRYRCIVESRNNVFMRTNYSET